MPRAFMVGYEDLVYFHKLLSVHIFCLLEDRWSRKKHQGRFLRGVQILLLLRSRFYPVYVFQDACYIQENEDLNPETSINKDIEVSFDSQSFNASVIYFHNDYDNKIYSGIKTYFSYDDVIYLGTPWEISVRHDIYKWENAGDAVVEVLEGSVFVALGSHVDFRTNVTYMLQSEMKKNGQPLSIIPKYTVNSFIDWRATDSLTLGVNATFYGKQEPLEWRLIMKSDVHTTRL